MYTRMVIGDEINVDGFSRIYHSQILPKLREAPGFQSANLMVEDGGRMAISLTVWDSRDDCLKYHSSLAYREIVEKTHHLLKGDLVVKLFEVV
jgi:heme-degrading monooxygenase HmoA